jgi:predicted nucleotidyltransferase
VELLTDLRSELIRRVQRSIDSWKVAPVHASLFGSAARGDGDTSSDIDLFVVRPRGIREDDAAWRRQLDDLAQAVHDWTGNHAGISEVGEHDLSLARRGATARAILADGITLAGKPANALFGSAA